MIIFGIVIIIFVVSCFFIGRRVAKSPKSYLRKYSILAKVLLFAYIVFAGCFTFPICSEPFPLDFMKVYLIIVSYGMIGLGFIGVYGVKKERFIYVVTLGLTVIGMGSRYILEYGETSNIYNFTVPNSISYIIIIPIFTVVVYHYIAKYLSEKN